MVASRRDAATANDGDCRTGDAAGTAAGHGRPDDKHIDHLWCGEPPGWCLKVHHPIDILGCAGLVRARARYQEASNGQARCHRGPISGWFRLDGPEQTGVPGVSERGLSGLGEV